MMTPILFMFQAILLVLGLGVGYLLLLKANTQEENDLKNIGKTLGWALIVATIILEAMSFSYSIAIVNKYSKTQYCPINNPNANMPQYSNPQETSQPTVTQPPQGAAGGPETQDNTQEPETEGRPVENQDAGDFH